MKKSLIPLLSLVFAPFAVPLAGQAADVEFKPKSMKYPSVMATTCRPKKVEAINVSGQPIDNPGFEVEGDDVFSIQRGFGNCPNPLPSGEKCRVYVDFCPQAHKTYKAKLVFSSGDAVSMTGRGSAGPGGGGK